MKILREQALPLLIVAAALFFVTRCAHADLPKWDIVSSAGMAYKGIPAFNSSYTIREDCKKVSVVVPQDNPRRSGLYSCGGDEPAFVGYPIAFKRKWLGGLIETKFGIFHQSQWFDGKGETQWTGPSVEMEFNWSEWRRRRRQ